MQLKKEVTNRDFNEAYANKDNKNIIYTVTGKYAKVLDQDTLESCGQIALWRCLGNHDDSYGQKFTTSLWRFVDWECKRELRKVKRDKEVGIANISTSMDVLDADIVERKVIKNSEIQHINECLNLLSDKDKEILYMYFFENRTMEEIGNIKGFSKQSAGQKIAKALVKFKNIYNQESIICQNN